MSLSGRDHPPDLSSPDEQSGALCFPVGTRCQCKHTGQPGKVALSYSLLEYLVELVRCWILLSISVLLHARQMDD